MSRPFPDPSILLHPQIPKPLHLLNPRTILGQVWWDDARRTAYWLHMYHCHACGIDGNKAAYFPVLEAHEMYSIDYTTGQVEFIDVVALCHACHNFIHQGRMVMITGKGEMEPEKFAAIMEHGTRLLVRSGIVDDRTSKLEVLREQGKLCSWEDYHLVVNGVNHGQRFKSMEEWEEYWLG